MDVMENLVELIGSTEYGNGSLVGNNFQKGFIEKIASHLIDHGVTVQELVGCEYCNGLPFSQMEDFTMPNASKKDYDIVTIRYCPICGRRLPKPPKGE